MYIAFLDDPVFGRNLIRVYYRLNMKHVINVSFYFHFNEFSDIVVEELMNEMVGKEW